jgi:hypothetical protein
MTCFCTIVTPIVVVTEATTDTTAPSKVTDENEVVADIIPKTGTVIDSELMTDTVDFLDAHNLVLLVL